MLRPSMQGTDKLRTAIIGAAGYTGAELVRLVHAHPRLELGMGAARERAGKRLSEVVPTTLGVKGLGELVLESFDPADAEKLKARVDVAFLALPHATSARVGKALYDAGVRVVVPEAREADSRHDRQPLRCDRVRGPEGRRHRREAPRRRQARGVREGRQGRARQARHQVVASHRL